MPLIRPFKAVRTLPEKAAIVSALPYDVMNTQEARTMAAGNPFSFLHVSRPEIDLPNDTDPYNATVYAQAALAFNKMRQSVLKQDKTACYYLYRLTFAGRTQLGIAAEVSVDAYLNHTVKKHEFTRPQKEDDRLRHINAVGANTGPVFLLYRHAHKLQLRALLNTLIQQPPIVNFTANDNVQHELWVIDDKTVIEQISATFAQTELYIADGHHRCAAAARACLERRVPGYNKDAAFNYFFGVLFADDEVCIYDYNRVVKDLATYLPETFLTALTTHFVVTPQSGQFKPKHPHEFGMFLANQWYQLTLKETLTTTDPIAQLDVTILAERVLEPLLGIQDPRRDARIDFVGGIRGLDELERLVKDGFFAVAFALFPTKVSQLLAVADSGNVMPPKSTWFEPKLRDGLLVQLIDEHQ